MQTPGDGSETEALRLAQTVFQFRLKQALARPAVVLWLVVAALLFAGSFIAGASIWHVRSLADHVLLNGALMPDRVARGEWWRLLTGPFLHQSWAHLLLNLAGLVFVGRYVESAFGRSGFVLLYLGASLAGGLGTTLAGHAVSIGASGAIFGLLAAWLIVGGRLRRQLTPSARGLVLAVPLVLLVGFTLLGVISAEGSSDVDAAAHLGGALGGGVLGTLLPLELRDLELRRLMPSASSRVIGMRRIAAVVAALIAFTAIAMVVTRATYTPSLQPATTRSVEFDGGTVILPADFPAGVWRVTADAADAVNSADTDATTTGHATAQSVGARRCDGSQVDPVWTLTTHRVACFTLPLAGLLLVGRPAQLLTMDAADRQAMALARRERRFVWRQPNVMIAPAGHGLLFVIYGFRTMLAGYSAALSPLLPPPNSDSPASHVVDQSPDDLHQALPLARTATGAFDD